MIPFPSAMKNLQIMNSIECSEETIDEGEQPIRFPLRQHPGVSLPA
jgi:hypothetical protein